MHTPGPWHWNENETDKRSRPYVRCNVKLPGALDNVAVAKVTGEGPEMSANARLIAAAPDLYRELKALLERHGGPESAYKAIAKVDAHG